MALDRKWLGTAGSVFEASSSDRTARGGKGAGEVRGVVGLTAQLIPIDDVSANCVRLNERDTAAAVEVHYFFSFISFFNRSGTQAVSGGNTD